MRMREDADQRRSGVDPKESTSPGGATHPDAMGLWMHSTQTSRMKEVERMDTVEERNPGWTRLIRSRQETGALASPIPAEVPRSLPETVIERGYALEGKLSTDRAVRVEGELRGSIVTSDIVVISERGSVEGEIRARSIVIRGAVVGNVIAARDVILEAGGKLHGDVDTASFVVERGAYFNGRTSMRLPQHASRGQDLTHQPAAGIA
jgi:cytoskeletal protein CcmA (bactofilin family)